MTDQTSVNELFGVDADVKAKSALPKLSDSSARAITSEEKRPIYENTAVQLSVACGGFLLIAMLLKSIFFSGGAKVAKIETIEPVQANQANPYDKMTKENAELRAKLGIRNQENFVVGKATTAKPAKVTPQNVVAVRQLPVIQRVSSPPQIRTVERIVYRTVPRAAPASISNAASTPRFYSPSALPTLPSDPEKVIANLGNQIVVDGSSSAITATPAGYNSSQPNEASPYPIAQLPDSEGYPTPSTDPSGVAMNARTFSTIPSGAQGRGELTVPIIAPKGMDISQDEFEVKVTKAIGDIPKGAMLVVNAEPSDSGFFRLKPVRAYKDGQDIPVPDNLTIRSNSGSALIKAKVKKPGSGFGMKDLVSPVFSALRGVASNAISGNSSTVSSNGFTSYSSTSQRNPFAAAGAGLADGILGNVQNRTSQVQSSQAPYSLIPDGTEFKLVAK